MLRHAATTTGCTGSHWQPAAFKLNYLSLNYDMFVFEASARNHLLNSYCTWALSLNSDSVSRIRRKATTGSCSVVVNVECLCAGACTPNEAAQDYKASPSAPEQAAPASRHQTSTLYGPRSGNTDACRINRHKTGVRCTR